LLCCHTRIDGFVILIAFWRQLGCCTLSWAVLAGSILALPVAAFTRRFRWALMLTALVVCECAVLAANRGRCPLTDWASSLHQGPGSQFRHLPAQRAGSEQQGDIWHPVGGE
jgi:hypothetical protein